MIIIKEVTEWENRVEDSQDNFNNISQVIKVHSHSSLQRPPLQIAFSDS